MKLFSVIIFVMSRLNVFFVRTRWNFYSIATLFGVVEDFPFVSPSFIDFEKIESIDYPERSIFCFSLNTVFYNQNREKIISILQNLKNKKRCFFIAGGPHCHFNPPSLLDDGFDAVSVGSGEKNIISIIFDIKNGGLEKSLYNEVVEDLNEYKPFPTSYFRYKPIEITRGCPHCCSFCQTSFIFGTKLLHRSCENILKFVDIAFKHGIKDFRFISPNALSYGSLASGPNPDSIEELLSGIRKILGRDGRIFFGSFPSEVRPEFVNEEVLKIFKKYVDNKRLIIGAQSGSERLLKLSHRGHTKQDIFKAIDLSLDFGFTPDVDIIFGMPNEEEEDILETLNLLNSYLSKNVRFHIHYFMPLPGTPWQDKLPSKIPQSLIRRLEYYTGLGLIWGQWKQQQLLSELPPSSIK